MMTKDYLEQAITAANCESAAEFARKLGLNRSAITRYREGERVMDDYTAARVAELLDLDPMIVIAQANAEREKDDKKRAYWGKFAAAASVVMSVCFVMTITPKTAEASTACSGTINSNANSRASIDLAV